MVHIPRILAECINWLFMPCLCTTKQRELDTQGTCPTASAPLTWRLCGLHMYRQFYRQCSCIWAYTVLPLAGRSCARHIFFALNRMRSVHGPGLGCHMLHAAKMCAHLAFMLSTSVIYGAWCSCCMHGHMPTCGDSWRVHVVLSASPSALGRTGNSRACRFNNTRPGSREHALPTTRAWALSQYPKPVSD